jgi:ABC-type transport system involved in cytochrome bd biosynthesis fused ATPase/permease subunit
VGRCVVGVLLPPLVFSTKDLFAFPFIQTTLLLSLLGETSLLSGSVFMHQHFSRNASPLDPVTGLSRTVAYAGQQPWLVGASIRQNIVFGSPWDKKRYEATIKACQLERDIEILELGDATEVGEKGTGESRLAAFPCFAIRSV